MSYEQKYLKYKQKYLELKKQLEMNGGGETITNDISVNTESVFNLSETPVGQTGGFLGLFKSKNEPQEEPQEEPQQESQEPETELNLTETPVVANEKISNEAEVGNQKIYTEINLGPESNMKNVVLSDTPTNEQSGGFFGSLGTGPAPSSNNAPCPGTQNPVPVGAVGSDTMANAEAAAAAERAAAEAAERAAVEAAAVESVQPATVESAVQPAPVESPQQATSKYSVGNSEVNNTEDIERLFSQLGGNYTDLVDDSSSSIFSTESDLSLTLSDDDLLENL